MSKLISCMGVLLLSSMAFADESSVRPAEQVVSVVNDDLNGDGVIDRALLIEEKESSVGLAIYLIMPERMEKRLAIYKSSIAWTGQGAGTIPYVQTMMNGSLQVVSENDAVGSKRWSQTLTIAYRKGDFEVIGYTHSSRDTLDPETGGECDVNLATGEGVQDGKKFKTKAKVVKLADWSEKSVPEECKF